jgi:hypothetical protein
MEGVPDIPSVNVCCGIMLDRTAGHCLFHGSSTSIADCLDMLENVVFPKIVAEVDGLIFQRDGGAAHFGAIVRTALNERFPGQWIAGGGSINWPPRSPDSTPMDFFWGPSNTSCTAKRQSLFQICAGGLQRLSLWDLWMCSLAYGVKWNFVSTSVELLTLLKLNCTKRL